MRTHITDAELGYTPPVDVEGCDKKGNDGDYLIHFSNAPSTYFNIPDCLEDGVITKEQHDLFLSGDYEGLDDYFISNIDW